LSAHHRLDEQLEAVSSGRLVFDVRRRRLTARGADGRVRYELEITEAELRGLMQRLLLAVPQPLGDEPLAVAARRLLTYLEDQPGVAGRYADSGPPE
jgi:hypothetical protein